tara:strand:- start:327 stop:527 length:201 start_codon:yes stop_codon:yes gene_type:complete
VAICIENNKGNKGKKLGLVFVLCVWCWFLFVTLTQGLFLLNYLRFANEMFWTVSLFFERTIHLFDA